MSLSESESMMASRLCCFSSMEDCDLSNLAKSLHDVIERFSVRNACSPDAVLFVGLKCVALLQLEGVSTRFWLSVQVSRASLLFALSN